MAVQRFNITQNLSRFIELLSVQQPPTHHEADRASGIHHVATNTAVQILLACHGGQRLGRIGITEFFLQHATTDFFQILVNALERIGRVLDIGGVQIQQHIFEITNRAGTRTCAHTH